MNATSGPTSLRQFAEYDPESSSWRTWPDTGLWGSTPYKQTWPRCGMTCGGRAFELPTWGHHMGGNGSSSLLPTPEAKLSDSGPDYARAERPASGGDDLTTTLSRLLPTPTSRDWKDGTAVGTVPTNALLGRQVWELLPTPSASDGGAGPHLNRGGDRKGELLLPGVARSLSSGAGTSPRFDGGNGSSDATPPHQPNPDLEAGDGSPPDSWNG
jgi:hypothetical protein